MDTNSPGDESNPGNDGAERQPASPAPPEEEAVVENVETAETAESAENAERPPETRRLLSDLVSELGEDFSDADEVVQHQSEETVEYTENVQDEPMEIEVAQEIVEYTVENIENIEQESDEVHPTFENLAPTEEKTNVDSTSTDETIDIVPVLPEESEESANVSETAVDLISTNQEESVNITVLPFDESIAIAPDSLEEPKEDTSPPLNETTNVSPAPLEESSSECAILSQKLKEAEDLLSKQQENVERFLIQRDSAIEERNGLMDIVTRLNSEIDYLKQLHSKNSIQLKSAINSNSEIVTKYGELKTQELSLKYREQLLNQERSILDERIKTLSGELNKANLELETVKISQSSKISTLEIKLAAKTEELGIADKDVADLRQERMVLMEQIESLTKKLGEERDGENKISDDLRKKLASRNKIIDLYKSMKEDSDAKCKELMAGAAELQTLLKEAVEKYGNLEAKGIQIQIDNDAAMKQKNDTINTLTEDLEKTKKELKKVNAESLNLRLTDLSPTAAIAREFIKSGKTLSQIYCELVHASDELSKTQEENDYLKEVFSTIVTELQENAPFVKQKNSQYEDDLGDCSTLARELESMEMENNQLRENYSESVKIVNHYERENKRLNSELHDLGQQVCFLLKEMEISRGGSNNSFANSSRGNLSNLYGAECNNSYDLISKNLVTFSDIQEIQANNQKLLKLVRELTEKQEENEALRDQIESGELQAKLETLSSQVAETSAAKERMTRQVNDLIKQRDMYKKLYKKGASNSKHDNTLDDEEENTDSISENQIKTGDIKMLETQLDDYKKQISQIKEDQKKFEGMADSKEKLLMKQVDKLRKELSDLNDTYRKCYCTLESNNERNQILQSDLAQQKKKVTMFENRNEQYTTKIAELEMSMKYLQEKATNSVGKLSQVEVLNKNLQKECQFLRDTNNSLLKDNHQLNDVIQSQSIVVNHLQVIKDCVEKKGNEDKNRLETKLEEFSRECSLLQKKIDDKQHSSSLLSQFKETTMSVEEIKLELINAREELERKNKHIDELSSHEYVQAQNTALMEQIKDLEKQLSDRQFEVNVLNQQLFDHKKHTEQLKNIAESAELEAKNINDAYLAHKTTSESYRTDSEKLIQELKEKCFEMETELSLYNNNQDEMNNDLKTELAQTQEQVSLLSQEINSKNIDLAELNSKIIELSTNLQSSLEACTAKDVLHNSQMREMAECKEEIISLYTEINQLKNSLEKSENNLKENEAVWEEKNTLLTSQKDGIEITLEELREQNTLLFDQIESLNSQMISSQSARNMEGVNDSTLNDSLLNTSSDASDSKSIEKLMQVIKYLRKQRDNHHAMYSSMQTENIKLKNELQVLSQKEANNQKNSEFNLINKNPSSRHSEMVHQLETVNAISHSNKLLREERDNLLSRLNETSLASSKLEESLSLLQENNTELSNRLNKLVTENTCIQSECTKWKARVGILSERANRTNPEDWKRLQNEREVLAKMLAAEKETIKKLRDEALLSKLEKSKLEEQNNNFAKQQASWSDETKKQTVEINTLKKETSQLSNELSELKAAIAEKVEENKKLNENLANHMEVITVSRNKQMQLRKLAMNYKTQYEEVSKSLENANKRQSDVNSAASPTVSVDTDKKVADSSDKVSQLETQVSNALEENNSLAVEIEELRNKNREMEDKAMERLKEAKTKIILLTESRDNLVKQLEEVKNKLDVFEQNKDEHNDMLAALKSQYEGRIVKLEKEKVLSQQEQQNESSQLNKQIESLSQKVSQMQKHIDSQQIARLSPSYSQVEKPSGEPPTANIKPMSGSQQPIGGRRPGSEPPLASIRPMSSVTGTRTAAILPNAQYSVAPLQHHVQPTATVTEEAFIPGSSSVVLPGSPHPRQPPHGDDDGVDMKSETVPQSAVSQVALVSPRMETPEPQQIHPSSPNEHSSPVASQETEIDDHNESTSHKRTLAETEQDKPGPKRFKKNQCEAEYQVPTSSQKDDHDDSVIVVDSDDEDEDQEMDEMEEDEEGSDGEDNEEDDSSSASSSSDNERDYVQNQEDVDDEEVDQGVEEEDAGSEENVEEEGEELDEENEDEEEVDEFEENWERNDDDDDDIREVVDDENVERSFVTHPNIMISNVQGGLPRSPTRGQSIEAIPNYQAGRRSNAFNTSGTGAYEEGEDGIVPSTPTLFVPSRNDGFGEAVRSPYDERNVDRDARFSFGNPDSGSVGNMMENTQADLTNQLESRNSSNSGGSGLVIDISESGLNEEVDDSGEPSHRNSQDDDETGENVSG